MSETFVQYVLDLDTGDVSKREYPIVEKKEIGNCFHYIIKAKDNSESIYYFRKDERPRLDINCFYSTAFVNCIDNGSNTRENEDMAYALLSRYIAEQKRNAKDEYEEKVASLTKAFNNLDSICTEEHQLERE
jgi:hypothetical protein